MGGINFHIAARIAYIFCQPSDLSSMEIASMESMNPDSSPADIGGGQQAGNPEELEHVVGVEERELQVEGTVHGDHGPYALVTRITRPRVSWGP